MKRIAIAVALGAILISLWYLTSNDQPQATGKERAERPAAAAELPRQERPAAAVEQPKQERPADRPSTPVALTPVAPPTPAMPKAQRHLLDFDPAALTTYKTSAKAVGFRPDELVYRELRACLADHSIPEYPSEKVHEYLKDAATKQEKTYVWTPLRTTDQERWRKGGGRWPPYWTHRESHGAIGNGSYKQLVPQEVLETVDLISRYVPEAVFYVSEIVQFKDPFLAVGVGDHPMIVIAVWDEPGFTHPPHKATIDIVKNSK